MCSFQDAGWRQTQKSRRANWLMRLCAKPDLEKTAEQEARDVRVHRHEARALEQKSRKGFA